MSHFTRLQTRLVQRQHVVQALQDLGYDVRQGGVEIQGYMGTRTAVDFMVPSGTPGYDIGFRQGGDGYEVVADWWGIKDLQQEVFLQRLTQRYAYCAVRRQLEEQGFTLVGEEQTAEEGLRLTLRRVV